jgi:hypothetical protein
VKFEIKTNSISLFDIQHSVFSATQKVGFRPRINSSRDFCLDARTAHQSFGCFLFIFPEARPSLLMSSRDTPAPTVTSEVPIDGPIIIVPGRSIRRNLIQKSNQSSRIFDVKRRREYPVSAQVRVTIVFWVRGRRWELWKIKQWIRTNYQLWPGRRKGEVTRQTENRNKILPQDSKHCSDLRHSTEWRKHDGAKIAAKINSVSACFRDRTGIMLCWGIGGGN